MLQFWPDNFENSNKSSYRIRLTLTDPASSGRISLRSTDAVHMPRINPNMLEAEEDVARLTAGVEKVRSVLGELQIPHLSWPAAASVSNFVTEAVGSSWGYQGSCRMGNPSDPAAVVDSDCRVIGVEGVRVIDASIIPQPLPAGPLATTVLIAERMAQKLK